MNGNRIWMLGVTLVAVVVVAFGWLLAISPTLAQADLATSQAQSTDSQNSAQQIALVRLKSQYDNLSELKANLAKLQLAVPSSPNLDDFLDQVQQLAQSTGVTISGFTAAEATQYGGGADAPTAPTAPSTGAPTEGDSTSTPTAQAPAASVTDRLFSVPITIVVKGSPDQMLAFTDASQKGTRLFLITGDTFTGSRDNPGDDGGTITGFVFVARDTPMAVAPAK